jgi:hypothetical protein
MKNLYDPQYIESALSDFQIVRKNTDVNRFTRAEIIRIDTNSHLIEINKAYADGNRERFFALFQDILKQEQDRHE